MTFQENMVSQVVVACRGRYKYPELFAGLTGLFRGGTGGGGGGGASRGGVGRGVGSESHVMSKG